MCAIYGNMDPINIHPMLVYIPYMDPMGNSQWRSWKPLNVQEKCFFFTHVEIQSLSSHKLRNSHPVLSTAWDKFEKVTALPNESGLRGIQLEHFRNGNITCWDDLPPVLFFFADFSIFHPPNTRNTRSAMAAHVHCWLDRMVPQCTQARNSAYAPGRVHKTIGSPAINRSKIYGDDS